MKMMESHVCTNRLRIHLEIIHPLMKFGKDFLMRNYSYMDLLSNVNAAPSKTIINPMVLSPIFVEPWSKKIRSSNSSARNPLTRDLSGLGFVELQNGHVFTTC